jgi:hypothetical protein
MLLHSSRIAAAVIRLELLIYSAYAVQNYLFENGHRPSVKLFLEVKFLYHVSKSRYVFWHTGIISRNTCVGTIQA